MAKNRGKKRLLAGLLICAALAFALMRAFANLNGALLSLAEARAEQRALQQISLALDEVMHKSLDYEDFVDVHYDAEGEASMLSANTILMNRIAADAATRRAGEYRHTGRRGHHAAARLGARLGRVFRQRPAPAL